MLLTTLMSLALAGPPSSLSADVSRDWTWMKTTYEELHRTPELSFGEVETAARMAKELKAMGFAVTEQVGRTGVVGMLRNGRGPQLLLRADMDGLPVLEQTGLPYASEARGQDRFGEEHPTMHACGHDVHMTSLLGTLRWLTANKRQWRGTLMVVFQPAEELGLGARAMLDDGLYERFGVPDAALALHDSAALEAGKVGTTAGWALSNVDSVDIIVKGVGGHGAYPHTTIDPIVIGSRIVSALQTLVSRELDPLEPAVVTVGAFHAGSKHNIISDQAHLQLTVRSTKDATRTALLDGIQRIAEFEARSAGVPEGLLPEVTIEDPYTPATWNDPALTERVTRALERGLGDDRVVTLPLVMGGEDFSRYSRTPDNVPAVIFWVGAASTRAVKASKAPGGAALPSLHSPFFAPDARPTLTTAVEAMTLAALEVVGH